MQELTELARFVSRITLVDLPGDVLDRAKWVLRDTIAVIVGGMREPENNALAQHAAMRYPGLSQLMGVSGSTSPEWAVLVHGTAGTTLEMDEGHAFARGHAAIHAVPPALALSQTLGLSGSEMLLAFVVGYEVAARAGVATRLRKPVHPFGTWGVLGAAAIAARLKGMQAHEIESVLEVAASYAITPSFETAYQGANVRNTYAGMVNRLGLLAADMYELGYRGEQGALETTFGRILGESFNPLALTEGLGSRYEIMRGYFKPYSGCRYTHAAIDATLNLLRDTPVSLADIDSVEVETYDIAAHLTNPIPATPLAGRFSTPYVVAATLVKGSAGPEIFTLDVLHDPAVLGLSARVVVREDTDFTAMTPERRPARVILHFKDQTSRQELVMGSKGDPDQPMSSEELYTKFHQLAAPTIGAERASQLWDYIGHIDDMPDLSSVAGLLQPDRPKGGST